MTEQPGSTTDRIAELEREIAELERAEQAEGLDDPPICAMAISRKMAELSRLRNEPASAFYPDTDLCRFCRTSVSDGDKACENAETALGCSWLTEPERSRLQSATLSPPSVEAGRGEREALERAALAIHNARFAHPEHPREPEPWDRGDREYAFRLARAALQANGEAVAWRYRFMNPYGTWFFTDEKLVADGKRERAAVVEALYAAPPSNPDGVREALERWCSKTFVTTSAERNAFEAGWNAALTTRPSRTGLESAGSIAVDHADRIVKELREFGINVAEFRLAIQSEIKQAITRAAKTTGNG